MLGRTRRDARPRPPPQQGQGAEEPCWKPDPEQLTGDDAPAPLGEERRSSDRRNFDWPDRQEEALPREGREERDAEPPVGEGIEDSVGDSPQGEVRPEPATRRKRPGEREQEDGERCGEGQRVGETPVAEEIAVGDPESKARDIGVREHAGEHAERQDAESDLPVRQHDGRKCDRDDGVRED